MGLLMVGMDIDADVIAIALQTEKNPDEGAIVLGQEKTMVTEDRKSVEITEITTSSSAVDLDQEMSHIRRVVNTSCPALCMSEQKLQRKP